MNSDFEPAPTDKSGSNDTTISSLAGAGLEGHGSDEEEGGGMPESDSSEVLVKVDKDLGLEEGFLGRVGRLEEDVFLGFFFAMR